jgi:hypothetical protein
VGPLTSLAIAVGVAAAVGVIAWVFDSAPRSSRRAAIDRSVGAWAHRRITRPRRASHTAWMATVLVVFVLLIWLAR